MHAKDNGHWGKLVVTGEGVFLARPDHAQVDLAVITQGKTATDAARANAERLTAVLDAVVSTGLPRDAIRTTGLSISPNYVYDSEASMSRIGGYTATNHVAATAPVEQAAAVFDAGVGSGANESSGVSFGVQDQRHARHQALKAAVESAYGDATAACLPLNAHLRHAEQMTIDSGSQAPVYRATRVEGSVSTPVQPGDIAVTARVTIEFTYQLPA